MVTFSTGGPIGNNLGSLFMDALASLVLKKLVHLQHGLKNGSAKATIEGLSRSGECYMEAIDCLKSCYNHPRLIHQTHVKMILDATPLKDGTGKELRRLHDTVQQHLRSLKSMDYEPSGPFITSTGP